MNSFKSEQTDLTRCLSCLGRVCAYLNEDMKIMKRYNQGLGLLQVHPMVS